MSEASKTPGMELEAALRREATFHGQAGVGLSIKQLLTEAADELTALRKPHNAERLTKEQIERIREDGPSVITDGSWQSLCDLANGFLAMSAYKPPAPPVQSEMPEEPWQPEIFYLSREQYSGSQPATWLSDWRRWRDYAEKLRSLLAQREEIIDGLKVERDMLYAELARGKK